MFEIQKENSKLYILGEENELDDKIFNIKNVNYRPLSFMTVIKDNNNYTIWNVCTPSEHRNKKYFKKLFNYFIDTLNLKKSTIETYVEINYPENVSIYEKLGFEVKEIVKDSYYLLRYKQV